MRIALLDGDTLVYHAGRPAEHRMDDNDGWSYWVGNQHEGADNLDTLTERIREGTNADRVIFALSDYDNPNWRNSVMPSYKAHRGTKPGIGDGRPILWRFLRGYIQQKYEVFQRPTLEGDDVLGILATSPKILPPSDRIICSIDKDMNTIPAYHLNFTKQATEFGWEIREVTQPEADYFHLYQTLIGDTVDGYPGCKGVGKVNAKKILDGHTGADAWSAVVKAYEKFGFSESDALQNARVARICRASDYDFIKREVIWWTPPKE